MFLRRKRPESETETEKPPAAPQAGLFDRVLLVVDSAEPSIAAAHFAVRMVKQVGGELLAVYVVDTATMDYLMQMRIFVKEERLEFERDLELSGQRYLEHVKTIARNQGLEIRADLRRGSFHQTILRVAREEEVDAIVLGGWRRTITRKDATSVERQLILSEADCPVIIVKDEKR